MSEIPPDAFHPTAAPLSDPCEQAVLDWCKLKLKDLHARSGVQALTLTAIRYSNNGEIGATWGLHRDGACVIDQPSIAEGVRALKEKLAERAVTEVRA